MENDDLFCFTSVVACGTVCALLALGAYAVGYAHGMQSVLNCDTDLDCQEKTGVSL